MSNEIAKLKNYLGIGARANKYRIYVNFPSGVTNTYANGDAYAVLCNKCDGFPEEKIDSCDVKSQGRVFKLPKQSDNGGDFKATFYNDEGHKMRNDFMAWKNAIDHIPANSSSGNLDAIMADIRVEQLDSANNPTNAVTYHHCFVTSVSGIEFDGGSGAEVETFTVTWTYSYFTYGMGNDPENDNVTDTSAPTENDVAYRN